MRKPNATTTQNIKKMSSIAIRLCTYSRPSRHISRPAALPNSVERVIRRAMRATSSTDRVPTIAADNRHPKLL